MVSFGYSTHLSQAYGNSRNNIRETGYDLTVELKGLLSRSPVFQDAVGLSTRDADYRWHHSLLSYNFYHIL
jgi:hypothetical protein